VKITRVDAALGQLGKSKANEANAEALRRERRHHERQLGDVDRELERMADETRGRST